MVKMPKTQTALQKSKAARHFQKRTLNAGLTSTLKKVQQFYNEAGVGPQVKQEDINRHIHPRHKRAEVVKALGRAVKT